MTTKISLKACIVAASLLFISSLTYAQEVQETPLYAQEMQETLQYTQEMQETQESRQYTQAELDSIFLRRMDSIHSLFELEEVTVKAELPKTRMKGDAVISRVEGSVLSKVGNAEDVLSMMPGMMRQNGQLQVIGKGTPIYYINGRKVEDPTELSRLQSSDIREIEVIRTPGAQYDASANAVVRIRTIARTGQGWSVSIDAQDAFCPRYLNNQLNGNIAVQYRIHGLEVFAGIGDSEHRLGSFRSRMGQCLYTRADSSMLTTVPLKERHLYTDSILHHGDMEYRQHYNSLNYHVGLDWQLSASHSLGIRLERADNLVGITHLTTTDTIQRKKQGADALQEGDFVDVLTNRSRTDADGPNSWLAQTYYSGKADQLGIDLNVDYYFTQQRETALNHETGLHDSREVSTFGVAKAHMVAGKLVFSYPVWKGDLHIGAEASYIHRTSTYSALGAALSADSSVVKEGNYSLFAEYGLNIPKAGVLSLGLRYELNDMRYSSIHETASKNLTHHLYPSASFSTRLGEVQGALSYAIRTRRPNFRDVRSNIEYNNRYTLSTGNPQLRNEINHQLGLNARWRYLSAALQYECKLHGIFDWTYPYNTDGQVLITWVNLPKPIHRLSAFLNASPTIGVWHPNYTLGVQKQWLTLALSDPREETGIRTIHYHKPMLIFNANNAFVFPTRSQKHGPWQVEVNSQLLSGAHWGNALLTNWSWNLSLALQKSWLENDALSLRLQVSDLFHTASQGVLIDLGNYVLSQSCVNGEQRSLYDAQAISLSLRYRFNARPSRYKGTGAGHNTRTRM